MAKYKILFDDELVEDVYDTEVEAEEYALYLVSCSSEGAEILNMSNPGDSPLDDYEDPHYEIVEVDD